MRFPSTFINACFTSSAVLCSPALYPIISLLKRSISVLILSPVVLFSVQTIEACAQENDKDGTTLSLIHIFTDEKGVRYFQEDGSMAMNKTLVLDGKTYVFDASGYGQEVPIFWILIVPSGEICWRIVFWLAPQISIITSSPGPRR